MSVRLGSFPVGASGYWCHTGSGYPTGGTITTHGSFTVSSSSQSWPNFFCSGTGNFWLGVNGADGHDYYSNQVSLSPTTAPAPVPSHNKGDTLSAGQTLSADDFLLSSDGRYEAIMQGDGNFVLYLANQMGINALWSTSTAGKPGSTLQMQGDGNLVVYTAGSSAVWSSSTNPSTGDRLVMQSDANLVIYSGCGTAIWARVGGRIQVGSGCSGGSGSGSAPGSVGGYPWASAACQASPGAQYCPGDNWIYNAGLYDTWGYNYRNCTSYVAWRLSTNNGFNMPRAIGWAAVWGTVLRSQYAINATPARGAIAWDPKGHVAYVESVSADGSQVAISEYNYGYYPDISTGDGLYHTRTVATGKFQYIHVKDLP
jgi:surface antigen